MKSSTPSEEFDIEAVGSRFKPTPPRKNNPKTTPLPYLRGPIPWEWLQEATTLGAGALATGLAVWHLRALNRKHTFNGSLYQLCKWTCRSEKVTREGLHRLEAAGLVQVQRPPGRSPIITLIEELP